MNRKNLKIILVLAIIVIACGIFIFIQKNKKPAGSQNNVNTGQNQNEDNGQKSIIDQINSANNKTETDKDGFIVKVDRRLTAEEQKMAEDALAINVKVLSDMPKDSEASQLYKLHMDIGHGLYGLGRLTEARDEYVAAAKLVPTDYTSQVALFTVYSEMKDFNSALSVIEKAVELAPEKPDVWRKYITLEQDQFKANNQTVDSLFQQALSKTSTNIDIVVLYARFLGQTGDTVKAVQFWKMAGDMNPKMKDTYEKEINALKK